MSFHHLECSANLLSSTPFSVWTFEMIAPPSWEADENIGPFYQQPSGEVNTGVINFMYDRSVPFSVAEFI